MYLFVLANISVYSTVVVKVSNISLTVDELYVNCTVSCYTTFSCASVKWCSIIALSSLITIMCVLVVAIVTYVTTIAILGL